MKTFVFLMSSGLMLAVGGRASGQVIQTKTDWLIDPTPYRAVVTSNATELALENGLSRRVLRLAPNAATVDLQNLTSGEHVLRAIAPEARVTINGTEYAVGGLKGQPIANYIKAEWLDKLTVDPRAYRFTGWSQGPIEAPFGWKKRREWMAKDLKGVMDDVLSPGGLLGRNIFRPKLAERNATRLFSLLSLELWFRRYAPNYRFES